MIFAKSAFSIQVRKKLDLGFFLEGQNREKSIENWYQKWLVLKHCILSVFGRFGLHFGGQKSSQNHKIFGKMEVPRRLLEHYRFWAAFYTDFEALGLQCWLIFEPPRNVFGLRRRICRNMRGAFQVAELTLMIRATRSRSMDGWMDGWMHGGVLIRYMRKWMAFRRPLGLGFRGGVR